MDARKLKEAYQRLENLDERLTYKIRPRGSSLISPTADQVNQKLQEVAEYTVELKSIMRDFMLAFARAREKRPPEA